MKDASTSLSSSSLRSSARSVALLSSSAVSSSSCSFPLSDMSSAWYSGARGKNTGAGLLSILATVNCGISGSAGAAGVSSAAIPSVPAHMLLEEGDALVLVCTRCDIVNGRAVRMLSADGTAELSHDCGMLCPLVSAFVGGDVPGSSLGGSLQVLRSSLMDSSPYS